MKKRLPRKLKKSRKGIVLLYDLVSCPKGMTFKEVMQKAKDSGILLYDSTLKGKKPYEIRLSNGNKAGPIKYKIVDISEITNQ